MKSGTKALGRKYYLTCFGTGDGSSSTPRNHAAFLYHLDRTSILVDCGEPLDRSCKASGLSYDAIDSIFISHLHADHFGGFFMLMQGFRLEGRKKDLHVYLPREAIQPMRQMLDAAYLFDEVLPFQFELHPLKVGHAVEVGQATVTPYPTSHLDGTRARFAKTRGGDFQAYSFLLQGGGRRVGYSGDVGQVEDLEPLLAKPLDLLVCELSHLAPEVGFRYLQGRNIQHTAWIHLGLAQRQNLAKIRRLAAKMLPTMKHTFACDGDEIAF